MTLPKVRLSGPAKLAAVVPSLLGFTPGDTDLVVIGFTGQRVAMTARVDHPGVAHLASLARQLLATLERGASGTVDAVAVVSWNGAVGDAYELLARLTDDGLRPMVALTVRTLEGRVLVEPTFDTADAHWVDLTDDELHAVSVVHTGRVNQPNRAALRDLFAVAGESPTDEVRGLARMVATVHDRDRLLGALGSILPEERPVMLERWARVARTYPAGDDVRDAALTICAVTAYVMGDGAMARTALEGSTPGYRLAVLLTSVLDMAVPPRDLLEILRQL